MLKIGSRVRWCIQNCELTAWPNRQPVVIKTGEKGLIIEADDDWTVRWDSGIITDSIFDSSLSEISPLEQLALVVSDEIEVSEQGEEVGISEQSDEVSECNEEEI